MGERVKSIVLLNHEKSFAWADGRLPLHTTVVTPTEIAERDLFILADRLHAGLSDTQPFEIIGEDEDLFGPKQDIRVRRMAGQALFELHSATLPIVQQFGSVDLSISAEKYVPHTTFKGGMGIEEGKILAVNEATVAIQKDIAGKKAWLPFDVIPFGTRHSETTS